jgi:CheY-like chemotaxis protein
VSDPARPVLVVDDDEAIRESVAMILVDEGYTVAMAGDGDEALEIVGEQSPALILLDIRMPRMNGLEFAAAYHALPGPHAPIVVMTAGARAAATRGQCRDPRGLKEGVRGSAAGLCRT